MDLEAAGQDEQKYTTSNPLVRWLIGCLLVQVGQAIGPDPGRLADIGTGEGLALARVTPEGVTPIGVEFRFAKLALAVAAVPGLGATVGDVVMQHDGHQAEPPRMLGDRLRLASRRPGAARHGLERFGGAQEVEDLGEVVGGHEQRAGARPATMASA